MREMSKEDKQFVELYEAAIKELHTDQHEATQKMLDFWGIQHEIESEEVYKRVQLMIEQEKYTTDIYGQLRERDWLEMSYGLGAYRDDYKAFVDQLIAESQRTPVATDTLSDVKEQYYTLRKQAGYRFVETADPVQNNQKSQDEQVRPIHLAPLPSIRHGHTDDIESYRWEDQDLKDYSSSTTRYFQNLARHAIENGVPLIHISPEQACSLVKFEKAEKKPEPTPKAQVKPDSPLANFLSKFAEKSAASRETVAKAVAKLHQPEPIGRIQKGMQLIIPANTINMFTGEKLPEMTVDVYDVVNRAGQAVISTSAGVFTTREMSHDVLLSMQQEIAEMTYKIEHADEIRAKEEAFRREFDYKHNWFANMEHQMPAIPRDDRLDIDDMRYFGYTVEQFRESQNERSTEYEANMAAYEPKAYAYAQELVQKCLDNDVRIVFAGTYRSDFQYYGETPEMSSRPDFSYGKVPDKWTHEVYLPDTAVDAITGQGLEYGADKMKSIWDTIVIGENPNMSFGLIGENVNGEVIMITSMDIRDVVHDMTQNIDVIQENDGHLEEPENGEPEEEQGFSQVDD